MTPTVALGEGNTIFVAGGFNQMAHSAHGCARVTGDEIQCRHRDYASCTHFSFGLESIR